MATKIENSKERIKSELNLSYSQLNELTSDETMEEVRNSFLYDIELKRLLEDIDATKQHIASLEWVLQQIY